MNLFVYLYVLRKDCSYFDLSEPKTRTQLTLYLKVSKLHRTSLPDTWMVHALQIELTQLQSTMRESNSQSTKSMLNSNLQRFGNPTTVPVTPSNGSWKMTREKIKAYALWTKICWIQTYGMSKLKSSTFYNDAAKVWNEPLGLSKTAKRSTLPRNWSKYK